MQTSKVVIEFKPELTHRYQAAYDWLQLRFRIGEDRCVIEMKSAEWEALRDEIDNLVHAAKQPQENGDHVRV